MNVSKFSLFKNEEEFQELLEALSVSETCHHYGIPLEEEMMAMIFIKNPIIIDELMERLGAFQPIPHNQIKRLLTKNIEPSKLAVHIAKAQVEYWEQRALKKRKIIEPLLAEEKDVLTMFFLFFCPLVGVTETHFWYSFDWIEEA